jgi:hypothetical protein
VDLWGADAVEVSGQHAFVTDFMLHGLHIFDVSTPSTPFEVGAVEVFTWPVWCPAIAIAGQYVYFSWHAWNTDSGSSLGGLKLIDVSDPSDPFEAGSLDFPDEWVGGVAVYRGYAYVGARKGIRIIDVSTATAPAEIGFVEMPCRLPDEIAIDRGYAWIACSEGGLRVMDLSDPESPVEVGYYDPELMLTSVSVGTQHAVAANHVAGLLVFEKCELPVFADGFESGDTSAWSATVP